MIDYNIGVGMFLIDASTPPRKAFRADIWIIGLEDASDLTATA